MAKSKIISKCEEKVQRGCVFQKCGKPAKFTARYGTLGPRGGFNLLPKYPVCEEHHIEHDHGIYGVKCKSCGFVLYHDYHWIADEGYSVLYCPMCKRRVIWLQWHGNSGEVEEAK